MAKNTHTFHVKKRKRLKNAEDSVKRIEAMAEEIRKRMEETKNEIDSYLQSKLN